MNPVALILSVVFIVLVFIPFTKKRTTQTLLIACEFFIFCFSGFFAIEALTGQSTSYILIGSIVTGNIPIVIDPLAAWFILLINFTFLTGSIYGNSYMKAYADRKHQLSLHWISYLLSHIGLLAVCVVQHMLIFLFVWEIMALSSFIMVIFESEKSQTIKAGINYLIQSHIGILLLTIGFGWVYVETGSWSFDAIKLFGQTGSLLEAFGLMLLFFAGFSFKAGFVPFHTWLPQAHPAAPAHVSGVMSGVLIKIGIYGILRMLLLLPNNTIEIGIVILIISIITGIYGVMLAIVQHNLKTLLAYHSIENIGIIGIGIGVGCLGLGLGNEPMAAIGFAGALLHTLNHSLFKSVLFYGAGNVYQATHSVNIESFGGLIKRMPHTAFLFLIASLAISGLPPFNGFISEFLIYSGLINGWSHGTFIYILIFAFAVFGLSLIGGLAILCFTKAFGTIFLGSPRQTFAQEPQESSRMALIPMYIIIALIIAIGVFPSIFVKALWLPVQQFTGNMHENAFTFSPSLLSIAQQIGIASLIFMALTGFIWFIRYQLTKRQTVTCAETWGCGYIAPTPKMQYTASSFVRTYRKLAEPILLFQKHKKEVSGIFPHEAFHSIHSLDRVEMYLIHMPLKRMRFWLNRFSFLQNGSLQFYILYGLLFIIILIAVPSLEYLYHILAHFLNIL
ncbi:proton-conducting transporter membrane subunit [Microbacter margulisiae]|uniref:Formate hydrogenlyase subunit 3/multisubunit Na+/H+ antiporter MnhD subunit n=1 Tax=Microbacter margulisiae TaxID=1350067 RepID=A0A7W5H1Y3_9PORP|nr:proton-conducting transporter membrane subunit [Microbacter margulisiae]MBB3186857.1 formate hydrogenlyase subunit 3/multisubunit Na+/H+ antiporter MnhD subunit [Microbacter margulisiae]